MNEEEVYSMGPEDRGGGKLRGPIPILGISVPFHFLWVPCIVPFHFL